ncbi:Crossover junction endonuclease MUS81, partial [Dictyocoela roeselum]
RIDFRTRNLPVGAFLWIRNVRGAEYLFDYVLERKKGDDFVHSIVDGRFKEQKKRLLECGVKNVIYIVEGLKTRHFRKINAGFGLSCLYSTKVEGLLVVETDNIEDTMEFVSFVDKSIRTNPNAVLTNILFDQFADNSAKNININIKDLMYRTLLSIKGMTHERAKGLSEKYKTFANFFDKVKHEFEISNLQFEGKVVGENVARKIFDFFGLSGSK